MHETYVTAEVFDASPQLKGIGVIGNTPFIDMQVANARKIPVILGNPEPTTMGAGGTADLTMAMLLGPCLPVSRFRSLHAAAASSARSRP